MRMLCIHDIFNFNSLTLDIQQESGYADSFDFGSIETIHIPNKQGCGETSPWQEYNCVSLPTMFLFHNGQGLVALPKPKTQ